METVSLTFPEASRIIREVDRYIRWKRNEWGATPDTLRDYESVLAKLALYHADLELADFVPPVGTERLRACWDHYWGERAARTRAKVRSVWVDFFDWAVRERGLAGNPARALAAPKKREVKREPYSTAFVQRVITSQRYLADRLGVMLILTYALRRAELANVRFGDFDFERRRLSVIGKGGKTRYVPIVDEHFWRDLGAVELEAQAKPEHFLVCHRKHFWHGTRYYHAKGYAPRSLHTWWYDRLEEAGIVSEADRTGCGMHRGRHTVATDILRATGNIVAAQKMLGHASIETTIRSYAQFDDSDLARVLRDMREVRET
jgi:site-specific recombinase XerC